MSTVRTTRGNGAERGERVRAGVPATMRAVGVDEGGGVEVSAACRVSDALAGHLAALGPEVKARLEPDGQVTLTMPETWACLYLATIRAQAETTREQLRRADQEAKVREAEQYVQSGAPAREWEREQAAIFAEYRRLVGGGVSHREALHRLKAQAGGRLTVTDLEEVVRAQGTKIRRAERTARAERIREAAGREVAVEEIVEREELTEAQVRGVLRRGRVPLAPFGPKAAQRERRERILALHAQGLMPEAIQEQTGFTRNQVMNTIQGVPRGTAGPRATADG